MQFYSRIDSFNVNPTLYVFSDVPRCVKSEKETFGANIGSSISVKCTVDAFPAPTSFSWGFNNSKDAVKINEDLYDMVGSQSRLQYHTVSDHQFGHLYCWARNMAVYFTKISHFFLKTFSRSSLQLFLKIIVEYQGISPHLN